MCFIQCRGRYGVVDLRCKPEDAFLSGHFTQVLLYKAGIDSVCVIQRSVLSERSRYGVVDLQC